MQTLIDDGLFETLPSGFAGHEDGAVVTVPVPVAPSRRVEPERAALQVITRSGEQGVYRVGALLPGAIA